MRKRIIALLSGMAVLTNMVFPASASEALIGLDTVGTKEIRETETETEAEKDTEKAGLNSWKVVIDPGHQGSWVDMSNPEPAAPGSSETKARCTTGTSGRYSGLSEYELNLEVSLVLRTELESRGYEVVMTREDHDTAISNKERAELATRCGADITVRIHANGSDDESVNGALTMVPSESNPYVGELAKECYELGEDILTEYCAATGFSNLGVGYYDNMTGINWSTIPVTILEMGFMSNPDDDLTMADSEFWPVMATGIADGIDRYFEGKTKATLESEKESEEELRAESETEKTLTIRALHDELEESLAVKAAYGENWSAAVVNLTSGEMTTVNDQSMQAASLIKLFIMGAVFERYDALVADHGMDNIDSLLYNMITVSDNTAANTLTNYLGHGDDAAGREIVTKYCQDQGYENTVMGRMLLASKENGDNMTSVSDCAEFLWKAYRGELPHSETMLNYLKKQERLHKIPRGLPEGVESGNKTGELDDVENDVAIVFSEKPYILCVMSEYLKDCGDAQNDISNISTEVYQFAESQF